MRKLQEKYIIAKKKSKELIDYIRNDFFYEDIDIAFAIEEEVAWYLIKVIDDIDNGLTPNYKFLDYLKQLVIYYSKFFKVFNRREFVPTNNQYKDKDYLFFAMDNSHYSRLKNVINEFPKDKIVVLATDISVQKVLKENGIDFISFGDYLVKPKKKFKINIENMEWVYKGVDLKKIFRRYIKYLEKRAEWIAYYIESLKKIYSELEIKKVITIDSLISVNRTAVLVAKNMGIESWIIRAEIVSKESGRYYLPVISDKICVPGDHDEEFLIKSGLKKENTFKVGMDIKIEKESSDFNIHKKIILFLSHFYDDLYSIEKMEKGIIMEKLQEIAKIIGEEYEIIIKLHPREEQNIYRDSPNIRIIKDKPSAEYLIDKASIVLIATSTSSLKAIAMNKPLLILDYANIYMPINYKKYGIRILGYDDDLIKAIKDYNQKGERRKELLEDYCGKISNSNISAKKIKNLIMNEKVYKKQRMI